VFFRDISIVREGDIQLSWYIICECVVKKGSEEQGYLWMEILSFALSSLHYFSLG